VPAIKKTGDPVQDVQLEQEHAARIDIIDTIMKDSSVVLPLHGFLTSHKRKRSIVAVSDAPFPDPYSHFNRLPTYWMSAHLESVTSGALTKGYLETLMKKDHGIVRSIFHYAHQTNDSDYWPRPMLVKSVLGHQFALRYVQVGSRLADFSTECVIEDDIVDMLKMSPYRVDFKNGIAVKITHTPTGCEAIPKPHQVITPEFVPENMWSDKSACLELDGTTYTMSRFFQAGTGPHKFRLDSKSSQLMALKTNEHPAVGEWFVARQSSQGSGHGRGLVRDSVRRWRVCSRVTGSQIVC